jgi:hypothetical protein
MLDILCLWRCPLPSRAGWHPQDGEVVVEDGDFASTYEPLGEPTLHRIFADVELSAEGVYRFVNEYGLLMTPLRVGAPAREPTALWLPYLAWMRYMVELWDHLAQGETNGDLADFVKVTGDAVMVRQPDLPANEHLPAYWAERPRWWRAKHPFDKTRKYPTEAVATYLAEQLDEEMHRVTRPGLEYVFWSVGMRYRVNLPTLWSALVWQFAQAVVVGKQFVRCAVCRKWLEETGPRRGEEQTTCSPACRQKLYRQRIEEAKLLRGQGVKVDEIARRLKSGVATVKRWLK